MHFEISSKPNIFTVILPGTIPLPKFSLFAKFEIDGVTAVVTGIEFCRSEVAQDRDVQAGWIYQLDDGSSLTMTITEEELLGCLPINQVEVIAIAS